MTSGHEPAWYAIVDTAQDPELHQLVHLCRDVQCLVAGDVAPVLAVTLPYLVRIDFDEPLIRRWRSDGVGTGWGIMMQSRMTQDALRLHFKKLLNVKLPDGQVVWFRFFDPAVLLTFLRACDPAELEVWFRGIDRYAIDDESGRGLSHLSISGGRLIEADPMIASG